MSSFAALLQYKEKEMSSRQNGILKTITYFSEIYDLKKIKRSGWAKINAEGESIADHIALTAQIAFILAMMEGLENPEKCAAIAIFHDNDEPRLGDIHPIADRYLKKDEAIQQVLTDQLDNLPKKIAETVSALMKEKKEAKTPEAIIAEDADRLEAALHAKILMEQGRQEAREWIKRAKNLLRTESAKKILAEVEKTENFASLWWKKEQKKIMQEEKEERKEEERKEKEQKEQ